MRTLNTKLIIVLAAVSITASSFAAMDRNAFLRQPARTNAALVGQAKSDSIVMGRYMRHFGMTKGQVVDLLKSLHLDSLKEDGVYLVYNTPEWGEIRARALFFKKGMAVWSDPQGNVVLKESCGNPMVRGTDNVAVTVDASVNSTKGLRALDVSPNPDPTTAPLLTNNLPVTLDSSPQTFATISPSVPALISSNSFNPAYLLPIAAIAPFIKTSSKGNPPSSVPEPATMVALALGAGLVAGRRNKKK